jgi:hypothetical protein
VKRGDTLDLIETGQSAITGVAKIVDYFKSNVAGHFSDTSLTSITKLLRSEPLTIISQDCANLKELPELLNGLSSIYSAYIMQAVAMLSRVNDVEVVRILDRLNPNRDSTGFLLQGRLATEGYHTQIKDNYKFALPTRKLIQEASDSKVSENTKVLYEMANLAVGKLLNVSISVPTAEGNSKNVDVPISVRLAPTLLNDESLVHLFSHRKGDESLVERFYAWRAGRIKFIQDLIFCQDLIDEYRRAAIKDKTGTLNEIVRRVTNARSFGLLTKNPSLAVSSNLYVLSKATAQHIESKVGQRFSSPAGREKLLKGTYAMIIAVVDSEWEQTTFYFNGIAQPSNWSFKAMVSANKQKGPDIADVMKSLLEGRAPTF